MVLGRGGFVRHSQLFHKGKCKVQHLQHWSLFLNMRNDWKMAVGAYCSLAAILKILFDIRLCDDRHCGHCGLFLGKQLLDAVLLFLRHHKAEVMHLRTVSPRVSRLPAPVTGEGGSRTLACGVYLHGYRCQCRPWQEGCDHWWPVGDRNGGRVRGRWWDGHHGGGLWCKGRL